MRKVRVSVKDAAAKKGGVRARLACNFKCMLRFWSPRGAPSLTSQTHFRKKKGRVW